MLKRKTVRDTWTPLYIHLKHNIPVRDMHIKHNITDMPSQITNKFEAVITVAVHKQCCSDNRMNSGICADFAI